MTNVLVNLKYASGVIPKAQGAPLPTPYPKNRVPNPNTNVMIDIPKNILAVNIILYSFSFSFFSLISSELAFYPPSYIKFSSPLEPLPFGF